MAGSLESILKGYGRSVGRGLERRDQQKYQALLEQLSQRREETSPQYQIALERLKQMKDAVTEAEKFAKGKESEANLSRMMSGFLTDTKTPGYISAEEFQTAQKSPYWPFAPASAIERFTKTYTGQPHVEQGIPYSERITGERALRRKQLTEDGNKVPGELKVASEAEKSFYGEPAKQQWDRDAMKWREGFGTKKEGFLATIKKEIARLSPEVGETSAWPPVAGLPLERNIPERMRTFAWDIWGKREPTLAPSLAKQEERLMEYHFGPKPVTATSLKKKWMEKLGSDYNRVMATYKKNNWGEQEALIDLEERYGGSE